MIFSIYPKTKDIFDDKVFFKNHPLQNTPTFIYSELK